MLAVLALIYWCWSGSPMLSFIIFLPAGRCPSAASNARPGRPGRVVFAWTWISMAAFSAWSRRPGRAARRAGGFGWAESVPWIPSAGVSYHVGVDGLSLPLLAVTDVLFLAVAVYSLGESPFQVPAYVCLFLFLQCVSLGLFAALDLILFFVFFDLSIVGMYFVIAGWGRGKQARAAATPRPGRSRSPGRSRRWSATGLLTGALFLLSGVLLRPGPHRRHGRLLRPVRPARRCSPR